MTIRAGELRHRIELQERATTQDAAGEPASTWETFAQVWAALERTPGSEVWASAQRNARVPTVFRIRHVDGARPDMRVVLGARVYDVKSVVDPTGRGAEMQLVCDEIVEAVP
jgi:SPP1 family predicted phage head-tail adaptor